MNRRLDVEQHPVRSGLIWSALFVPLTCAADIVMGQPITFPRLTLMIPLGIVAGQGWAFALWWWQRRNTDAR